MCYTQTISIVLALGMWAVAAYEHKTWRNWHYTMGLSYYGFMEALQALQHSWLAEPEDNYSMCASKTNQALTYLAGIHICYQPFFTNLLFQGFYRRHNLRDRIESDLVLKLCFMGGTWWILAFAWAKYTNQLAPPATMECPNYNWMRSGYDDRMDFVTPNGDGQHPCTYRSPSEQEHLAWVFPNYHTSYYQASTFLHAFLFFGPAIAMARNRPLITVLAIICYLTGPVFQRWLTPDINEQPAIWCYGSVVQVCVLAGVYRWKGVGQVRELEGRIEGTLGEPSIMYTTQLEADTATRIDGHQLLKNTLTCTATSDDDSENEEEHDEEDIQ